MALSLLGAGAFLPSCKRGAEIASRTSIAGTDNGSAFQGSITATIRRDSGGISSCTFEQLPPRFTPGTIGTHT